MDARCPSSCRSRDSLTCMLSQLMVLPHGKDSLCCICCGQRFRCMHISTRASRRVGSVHDRRAFFLHVCYALTLGAWSPWADVMTSFPPFLVYCLCMCCSSILLQLYFACSPESAVQLFSRTLSISFSLDQLLSPLKVNCNSWYQLPCNFISSVYPVHFTPWFAILFQQFY